MPIEAFGNSTTIRDIIKERFNDKRTIELIEEGKLKGRFVTSVRASAPTSATNVTAGDREGDIYIDGTYVYTLITVSGALKWDRRSHNTGW